MFKKFGKASIALTVIFAFISVIYASAAMDSVTIKRNMRNRIGDFDFEFWRQSSGEGEMTLTGGGTFECFWENADNILFRTGKRLGSEKPHHEYGEIIIDYAADYSIHSGNVSYLTVYGWTENPLIEFYIVESHGSYRPPGGAGLKGRFEIDGGEYDVFETTRVEQPSIQGTKTFQQYFSVRVDRRTEGVINVSEHFRVWEEEFGMDMSGNMYEIALCVEGFRSSGEASVYRHILTIGDDVYGADVPDLRTLNSQTDEIEPIDEAEEDESLDEPEDAKITDEKTLPPGTDDDDVSNSNTRGFLLIIGGAVVVTAIVIVCAKLRKK